MSEPDIPDEEHSLGATIIDWIERECRCPEGALCGEPIRLMDWQRDFIRKVYDNPRAVTRRAILSVGRKSGKTTFASCLLLAHLAGPPAVPNSQTYSAAQSRDQAALLYGLAAKIVRMSPRLSARIVAKDGTKQLHCPALGTSYRALSAEASTAYGLSVAFCVHDELGQVRGPRSELYEALETATAGQLSPLTLVISTQAPTDSDLLSILIDDALTGADPRVVCSLYTAPADADPFALETIKLANPALGVYQNPDEVLAMAADAKRTAEGLADKAHGDRVPYDLWASRGDLETTPGSTVSYEYVAQHLKRVFDEHHVVRIAFDRWNMQFLTPRLLDVGFSEQLIKDKFVGFGQGYQSMSPALRDLEGIILEKKLRHGGHPVLQMCASNCVVERDAAGNRKLSKKRSTGRIDGMVCLTMALGVAPLRTAAKFDAEALIA